MGELHGRGCHVEDVELRGQRFHHHPHVVQVAGKQPLAQRRACQLEPLRAQIRHGRHGSDLDSLPGDALDAAKQPVLAGLCEGDSGPLTAGTPRAADSVNVSVGV